MKSLCTIASVACKTARTTSQVENKILTADPLYPQVDNDSLGLLDSNRQQQQPSDAAAPERRNKKPSGGKVKRSDSLTKSEKTENNLKEKTEKRSRELKRADMQDSLSEKRPKEMRRCAGDGASTLPSAAPATHARRPSSDVRSRKHNVRELKERFEQGPGGSPSGQALRASPLSHTSPSTSPSLPGEGGKGGSPSGGAKGARSGGKRRTGRRGEIKRRHTVGGTKDLAKLAWLQVHAREMLLQDSNLGTALDSSSWSALDQLAAGLTPEALQLLRERLGASSPDLSHAGRLLMLPLPLLQDKENLRRLSVQENQLLPVLESHV